MTMNETSLDDNTSMSRFFQSQKKKPRNESIEGDEEEVEQLDDIRTPMNASTQDEQPVEVATVAVNYLNEENESNMKSKEEENPTASNPFAKFAFGASTANNETQVPCPVKKWTMATSEKACTRSNKRKMTSNDRKKVEGWIRMVDCSAEEQERIVEKWHSFADPNAPVQVRRFQVLVAARLHARCQEPVVKKCMTALRMLYDPLDAAALRNADSEQLAVTLSSLQYYNVKAKHIVAAANEIQTQFQGKVPESESELQKITGIGPVMADLLAFVNTVQSHTAHEQQKMVSSNT